jgi:metal-responsive CopG/Arc/MetJ family transcriptional regulator
MPSNKGGRLPNGAPNKVPDELKTISVSISFSPDLLKAIDALPAVQQKKISRSRFINAALRHVLGHQDPDYTDSDIDAIVGKLYG